MADVVAIYAVVLNGVPGSFDAYSLKTKGAQGSKDVLSFVDSFVIVLKDMQQN